MSRSQKTRVGVIPAAGEGTRAYPTTRWIPKGLLEIAGKPILQHNIEIMRDQLGIEEIYIILGNLGDMIRQRFGDGSELGVKLTYLSCPNPAIGLARGMLVAEPHIDEPFVTILGDGLYLDSNHHEIRVPDDDFFAVCAVMTDADSEAIRRNYAVFLDGDKISNLEEKPVDLKSDLLGCGTYLFHPQLFEAIHRAPNNQRNGQVELIDVIAETARRGGNVYPFFLDGIYVNVNSDEDYNYANYLARNRNFSQYKVSVVIPCYNEEQSIAAVVKNFIDEVDEVFVVDNSSADNSAEVARKHGARVDTVSLSGYGDTIKYGLDHATGDILVIVEGDYSFRSSDLGKMMEYLKDCDMVIGTRTTRELIEQGANMTGLLRLGNIAFGKLVELLWWSREPRFTDVGCTYRALWKEAWQKIRDQVTGVGPEFSPEMMIEILRSRQRAIEIPVSYHPRISGESKHSKGLLGNARTATRMLRLIFAKRFPFLGFLGPSRT